MLSIHHVRNNGQLANYLPHSKQLYEFFQSNYVQKIIWLTESVSW